MLWSPLPALAGVFGLSPVEITIILVVVLILFGPKSLPALGRALGKGMREFKDASSKFSEALENSDREPPPAAGGAAPAGRLTAKPAAPAAELPRVKTPEESVATGDRSQ